tara:strand:- start:8057 stop:10195 length:2139 start_codon:yes stop_codon:yes gene_type:complete
MNHHVFDWKFYISYYKDLRENGIINERLAIMHFKRFGKNENRITNQKMLTNPKYINYLDTRFYNREYNINNDFHKELDVINHWINYGQYEGLINNSNKLTNIFLKNLFIVNEQFKHIPCNTNKNKNLINILIRTSNRPHFFKKCLQSILAQSYKKYAIYVSYDNGDTEFYVRSYHNINYVDVIDKYNGNYSYNLYNNDLMDHINQGYILFLDDDTMLTHESSLEILNNNLDENSAVLWNILKPHKIIIPGKIIEKNEIDTSCVCIHHSICKQNTWKSIRAGDYYFFEPLINNMKKVYIPLSLTRCIYDNIINGHGMNNYNIPDEKYNIFLKYKSDINHLIQPKINLYCTNITNNVLEDIYENINSFLKYIKNYSNIILLCTDPKNYGGSSVNTLKLHHFFIQHKKKVKTIFVNNNEKNTYNDNIYTIRPDSIEDFLNQIDFNPDLIITKSPLNFNLKNIFDCPIYFFISGIYTNYLNKYYYDLNGKLEHDKFINNNVLQQIKSSTYSFSNSSHTQDILLNIYNLNTYILYTSFAKYLNKYIPSPHLFETRQYDYGIICSDFSRPIKNIKKSISRISDQYTYILIGNNSHFYSRKNVTTFPYIENISPFLRNIKYIIQDSYYESSSNLEVEALFSGCKIKDKCEECLIQFIYPNKTLEYIIPLASEYLTIFPLTKKTLNDILMSYNIYDLNVKKVKLFINNENNYKEKYIYNA